MVFIDDREAIVFDTPSRESDALELIEWVQKVKEAHIKAVVVNHFHTDCLGSLKAFHKNNIASYARDSTIALASTLRGVEVPRNGFGDKLSLLIGSTEIINQYHGEAHTRDNIVSYIPEERILFGGCMIKAMGAGKGNLEDANVSSWSATVERIRREYPGVKWVVPGHGKPGSSQLFDYTSKVFAKMEDDN
ncbi:MAG: subclass B1 metallo-beta-lactamase [Saprospiraceae bacterium]|nr:subclass B1 metallo-beta-lactamase [Saprospiraceae bacterium]